MSCIINLFKDNYIFTGNKDDVIKIKDIYNEFATSSYFCNLTKAEKKNIIRHSLLNMFRQIFSEENIM